MIGTYNIRLILVYYTRISSTNAQHCCATQPQTKFTESTMSHERQRNGSNILSWHYYSGIATGEPMGLRAYSHYEPSDRYEIEPCNLHQWKVVYLSWNKRNEPIRLHLKTGTLFECMEFAEIHDERIGQSLIESERE